MDAITRTNSLQRENIAIELLVPNEDNPNEMSEAQFNLLVDNIERTGATDALLVRPIEDGKYRVMGGHHRLEVCKLLDFTEVPCTIVTDPDFDDEQEQVQLMRMNVIRGSISPAKFMKLYEKMDKKYAPEVLAEMYGFADQEEFDKLIKQTAKELPKEVQADFKEAAKELKTVEGLSKLLNKIFTEYGDTLPFGYMIFDFNGKDSVWLRMSNDTKKALILLGHRLQAESRTMDDILGGLIERAAEGKLEKEIVQLIAATPPATMPEGFEGVPTKDLLKHV